MGAAMSKRVNNKPGNARHTPERDPEAKQHSRVRSSYGRRLVEAGDRGHRKIETLLAPALRDAKADERVYLKRVAENQKRRGHT